MVSLSAVYVIWGSTYLAIRLAVREGSGFPPFLMGAMRLLLAGMILFLWARWRGQRWRITWPEAGMLAATGILLWTGGNGLVVWAEQRADSSYAALLISTTPIWTALIESLVERRAPSNMLIFSLVVGFSGIVVLSAPRLQTAGSNDMLSIIALLIAPACWSAGSVLQRRRPVPIDTIATASYQHLFGGLGFVLAALLAQEPRPVPTSSAWFAWLYLVTIGSLIGFTSFLRALKLLPISIAMTYAYVNPVVAVILGRVILHEPITIWTVAGSGLVLLGVAGVFRERYGGRSR